MSFGIIFLCVFLLILFFIPVTYKYCHSTNYIHGVPKTIYQTLSSKGDIPEVWQKNIQRLKDMNPGWKYTLFDDEDIEKFILNEYGQRTLQTYLKINPEYGPARSDFFRYLLLYKKGGVYLDIKSNFKVPLDKIITSKAFPLYHWGKGKRHHKEELKNKHGEFIQFVIISPPKHAYLKRVIDNVQQNIHNYSVEKFGVGKNAVLKLTGPIVYTRSILEILNTKKHTIHKNFKRANLVYNATGQNHAHVFKNHYSLLTSQVVL